MTITTIVLADSISPDGIRLTTMQLRYPKFIHGEFMTHRVFSRNASSSRAIPIQRLIQDVVDDPAMPVSWGRNQKGMQAGEELPGVEWEWLDACNSAVQKARHLASLGLHKQIVNRIIEPFCHINVVVSATEWANFYALRRHADADPTMQALANAMWDAQQASVPVVLEPGEWHLPYFPDVHGKACTPPHDDAIKVSVARCARVSYFTHEGKHTDIHEDLALYERLVGSQPLHASPAEHQATPDTIGATEWLHREQHGNFLGWRQFRKMLPQECVWDR